MFDVAIVGGGPAGSSCAAFCANAGLRTLLLEREIFPREKVCGDCLNPACWPILRRLQLAERVRRLPHGVLDRVEFIGIGGRTLAVPLPAGDEAEIAIKRSLFDQLILTRARELGATICEGTTVTALTAPNAVTRNWTITAANRTFESRILVAADGRNSTVARFAACFHESRRSASRCKLILPLPHDFGNRVVLQFLPEGYSGQAPVGDGELNLCLVSVPRQMAALRNWAEVRFGISPQHSWRTITPLTRAPIAAAHDPFSSSAMRRVWWSRLRAREFITRWLRVSSPLTRLFLNTTDGDEAEVAAAYSAAHAQTLSRTALDQSARASRGVISAGRLDTSWKRRDSNQRCFDF